MSAKQRSNFDSCLTDQTKIHKFPMYDVKILQYICVIVNYEYLSVQNEQYAGLRPALQK
jgi:hypothetical protein